MKKIIIANWKMNPATLEEARRIFKRIKKTAIVCPPFVFISALRANGAQDVFYEEKGAYTGEISAKMLKNLGVKYVIIGHSERREMGETDKIINKKIKAALGAGLKVVFCVGEKKRDGQDEYFSFVKNQIKEGLKDISKKLFKNLIIAYEPVWAISSHKRAMADSPESALKMAVFIKRVLLQKIPVLYGGSVNPDNARGFLFKAGMNGLLVGSQSLIPENFNKILRVANQ